MVPRFLKRQILDSENQKSLQTTVLNLTRMVENSLNGKKTLWEKEKLLVLQTRKNKGWFGKGLMSTVEAEVCPQNYQCDKISVQINAVFFTNH